MSKTIKGGISTLSESEILRNASIIINKSNTNSFADAKESLQMDLAILNEAQRILDIRVMKMID